MHEGIYDLQTATSRTNYLIDGENIIEVAKSDFLPNLEIVDYYNSDPLIKTILTEEGVNLNELYKYVEPVVVVRSRNVDFSDHYDSSKRYIYPMRVCTQQDFIQRNFIVNKNFAESVKYRLCPDISEDDENFIIKNLYQDKNERSSFSIQILKCSNSNTHSHAHTCASDTVIQQVFDTLMFN